MTHQQTRYSLLFINECSNFRKNTTSSHNHHDRFKKNPPLSPARKKKLEAKKKKQAEKEAAERLRLAEENGTVAELEEQEGVFSRVALILWLF